MPMLIKIPPGSVATLSLEEVQRLTEEKAAKAIQATEWKQLSLPSPNENLESPLLLDILNTKKGLMKKDSRRVSSLHLLRALLTS
ncbi:hypothetical protein CDL15_Pgr010586 [Punica granatum]|uniref:Uncharacterized protein n=1 Tax=Punica granatum TaxID=22663 RepID=A0A218VS56_PUNGR|nr:hypothetical protein CDL15_Pgr010586 [Punica granatum]